MGAPGRPVSAAEIAEAAAVIKRGGIVAFPTETFYGLAVDPFNPDALRKLFALKGRPPNKPILVLVHGPEYLSLLTKNIPDAYEPLLKKFWPGPLTLIFAGKDNLPGILTDSDGTVGVRWSSHPVACDLAEACGGAITGTSANLSGWPPAVSLGDLKRIFPVGLDYIIDGGETPGGTGSTIIGLEVGGVKLLRAGVVLFKEIEEHFSLP